MLLVIHNLKEYNPFISPYICNTTHINLSATKANYNI